MRHRHPGHRASLDNADPHARVWTGLRFKDRITLFGHNVRMPDEHTLTLRQADQARADFAAIEDELDFLKAQLARLPTRKEIARIALCGIFGTAGLVIGWIELFTRW
jgi:hypothetical protein